MAGRTQDIRVGLSVLCLHSLCPVPWEWTHRQLSGSASGHRPLLPSQGMKVSCTHFQCAAGAFAYLREHFPQAYSVDMSRQILSLNVNLMLVRRGPHRGPVQSRGGDSQRRILDPALCTWQWGRGFDHLSCRLVRAGGCFLEAGRWEERTGFSGSPDGKSKISAFAGPGPGSGVPSGEVNVGQQEELSGGPHQCTGRGRGGWWPLRD